MPRPCEGLDCKRVGGSYVFVQGGAKVFNKSLIIQIEEFDEKGIRASLQFAI